jgi:hypothetical protein
VKYDWGVKIVMKFSRNAVYIIISLSNEINARPTFSRDNVKEALKQWTALKILSKGTTPRPCRPKIRARKILLSLRREG